MPNETEPTPETEEVDVTELYERMTTLEEKINSQEKRLETLEAELATANETFDELVRKLGSEH